MRSVLIADCRVLATQLTLTLRRIDVSVHHASTVAEADDMLTAETPDMLIADVDIPGSDLLPFLGALSRRHPGLMRLVCGNRDALPMIRSTVNLGIDDFVLKPLDAEELRLRVGRLKAARPRTVSGRGVMESFGSIEVDQSTQEVRLAGTPIDLTPRERSVLGVLMRHHGEVVSKERLAGRILASNEEVSPGAIETYVHRLRRKIDGAEVEIRTLRGLGYVLDHRRPRREVR